MKKYLLGSLAIAVAIAFSAFTTEKTEEVKFASIWMQLKPGFSGEKVFGDYQQLASAPAPALCPSNVVTCAVLVNDASGNGIIDLTEFNNRVNPLDIDSDGLISDDQAPSATYKERATY
jgi:hypothetical protein